MPQDDYLYPVISYKKLHVDNAVFRGDDSAERRRKVSLCDEAFQEFKLLRGEVLSQAIAVEIELDRVIAQYFVPCAPSEETDPRQMAFIDLVLGQESFCFNAKMMVVLSLIGEDSLTEIKEPSKGKFRKRVTAVMELRNRFAHSAVGVDWQSHGVALWYSKKQRWGFASKDDETGESFLGFIPRGFGEQYTTICSRAISITRGIWHKVLELQRNGDGRSPSVTE